MPAQFGWLLLLLIDTQDQKRAEISEMPAPSALVFCILLLANPKKFWGAAYKSQESFLHQPRDPVTPCPETEQKPYLQQY